MTLRRRNPRSQKSAPLTAADGPQRAAVYIRVSTEEQAASGNGLDVQRERCAAQAIAKGWSVDPTHIFADEGISGTKDETERPALAALLAAIDAKQIDAVIVLALDRLGRKTRIVLDLVERISAGGCEVVSCKENLDTSTPAGKFVLTVFAALAQLERDNIVQRTTDGRNVRGRRDGERGGRLPYGYRRVYDPDSGAVVGVEIDPEAALIVRSIFSYHRAGWSLRRIAAELAVPSPRGANWHASSIRDILDNEESYAGGLRGESNVAWPVILGAGLMDQSIHPSMLALDHIVAGLDHSSSQST